jgi:hypothetical protein
MSCYAQSTKGADVRAYEVAIEPLIGVALPRVENDKFFYFAHDQRPAMIRSDSGSTQAASPVMERAGRIASSSLRSLVRDFTTTSRSSMPI